MNNFIGSKTARIHWYGERGIINALVSHLASPDLDQDSYVARVKDFLDAICWADTGRPAWIDHIKNAQFLVEISLAEFGNPDLMVVCTADETRDSGVKAETGNVSNLPYVIFIEAKVAPYEFSAGSNHQGMKAPGYNSTINGQISLKYRFAQALSRGDHKGELTESPSLIEAYAKKLGDRTKPGRHLEKRQVVALLKSQGLVNLPEERCHYVALTWDDAADTVFSAPDNLQPRFLGADGSDRFEQMRSRYGWLGYQLIETALGLDNHREYQAACAGMLKYSVPSANDYLRYQKARQANELLPEEDAFAEAAVDVLFQECKRHVQQGVGTEHCKGGSRSLTYRRITVAKVIKVTANTIFVGVRDDDDDGGCPLDVECFTDTKQVGEVRFSGFTFDDLETADATTDPRMTELAQAVAVVCHRMTARIAVRT